MGDGKVVPELLGSWLSRRSYPDLRPEAERELRQAALCWHDEASAEAHLERATKLGDGHLAVWIARYRYHLYKHQFEKARLAAVECLAIAASKLRFSTEYLEVSENDADFREMDPDLRFWMFCLQAYGYVALRCGDAEEGRSALGHLARLDAEDQTKTRLLLKVLDAEPEE
jgi:hypothetical protein